MSMEDEQEYEAGQLILDNSCLCGDDLCIGCAVVNELIGDLRFRLSVSQAALARAEQALNRIADYYALSVNGYAEKYREAEDDEPWKVAIDGLAAATTTQPPAKHNRFSRCCHCDGTGIKRGEPCIVCYGTGCSYHSKSDPECGSCATQPPAAASSEGNAGLHAPWPGEDTEEWRARLARADQRAAGSGDDE